MSYQTFESIPQPITDQNHAATGSQTAELLGLVALSEAQQNKYEPTTDEAISTEAEHVEAPAPTLDNILTSILKDYRNGLFYSFRDQIPFYYPHLPELFITNGNADSTIPEAPPKK
jgi:hypothetical protein